MNKQDILLQEAAADLGAVLCEIERERRYYGEHTVRMAALKSFAEEQDQVLSNVLKRYAEKEDQLNNI